jgi:hypothetical protein
MSVDRNPQESSPALKQAALSLLKLFPAAHRERFCHGSLRVAYINRPIGSQCPGVTAGQVISKALVMSGSGPG